MNFTRSSVWPWFGSKLIGAWKSLASIPWALGRTGSFCAAKVNATAATSKSPPNKLAKVRFADGMNYLRRSHRILKTDHCGDSGHLQALTADRQAIAGWN
jgi:hypothetical protein